MSFVDLLRLSFARGSESLTAQAAMVPGGKWIWSSQDLVHSCRGAGGTNSKTIAGYAYGVATGEFWWTAGGFNGGASGFLVCRYRRVGAASGIETMPRPTQVQTRIRLMEIST